jgi:NADPH:quinone reductase-like Zn-dependent oxidoreductase
MQYLTAYGALVMYGKVGAGDNVLITAASSSVGLAAIQIVKDAGGVAIATTRHSAKREALLAQGADHVIATEEEDVAARVREITSGKMAQIIFDPVAGPFVEKLAEAAGFGGTIFVYGILSMEPTPFPLRPALGKGLIMRGYTLHQLIANTEEFARSKQYCFERLADGRFVPIIAKTFPFEQSVEAYRYLASNAQVGKVVITL